MGQYYMICNLDKRELIHPHRFGDGLKLLEFGCSSDGTMCALAILLSDGNGRGGGDLRIDDECPAAAVVGSWAADRIVVAGDYADPGRFVEGEDQADLQRVACEHYTEDYQAPEHVNLYGFACERYEDISGKVIQAMLADQWVAQALKSYRYFGRVPLEATADTPLQWDGDHSWTIPDVDCTYAEREEEPARANVMRPDMVLTAKKDAGDD